MTAARAALRRRSALLLLAAALAGGGAAVAQDLPTIPVAIKDHRFQPAEIDLPVGKPVLLVIRNEDATAEEFDSTALHVEKVILGGRTERLRLRPLGPGRYPFMGEYHPDTAQGVVVAK